MRLVQQEYERLTEDWGTGDPWQLQLALMLGDQPENTPTLLSQTMIAFGHTGMTWQWNRMPMPFDLPEESSSVWTFIEKAIWAKIQQYWDTGKGVEEQQVLARALKQL